MNIGKIKVCFERSRMWVGIVQFIMIGNVYISLSKESPIVLALGLAVILAILTAIDVKYILPAENKTLWEYNPAFTDMRDDMRKMKEDIKEILEKLE